MNITADLKSAPFDLSGTFAVFPSVTLSLATHSCSGLSYLVTTGPAQLVKKCASAGTRTRDSSLEGLHANPYTTDADVDIGLRISELLFLFAGHEPIKFSEKTVVGTVS